MRANAPLRGPLLGDASRAAVFLEVHELIVFLLVFSPLSIPVSKAAPPQQWAALKRIALEYEVAGPFERWILNDFASELRHVRRHMRELRDMPPLADLQRFPAHFVASDMRRANHAYRLFLCSRRACWSWRWREYKEEIAETDKADRAWKELEMAGTLRESFVGRRKALAELRRLIGNEDYFSGSMPAALPVR